MGNKDKQKEKKPSLYSIVIQLLKALHLEDLSGASKFNLACGALLFAALALVIAEPLLAYLNNIVATICNTAIAVFSERELLPIREVQIGNEAARCLGFFLGESIACPIMVFILKGIKLFTNK